MIVATATPVTMMMSGNNSKRRRVFEKARIQKLKSWHEDVKKIARSELDFIASIFKDDKNSENRDWLRDYEIEDEEPERSGEVVKKDA